MMRNLGDHKRSQGFGGSRRRLTTDLGGSETWDNFHADLRSKRSRIRERWLRTGEFEILWEEYTRRAKEPGEGDLTKDQLLNHVVTQEIELGTLNPDFQRRHG